MMLSRYKFQVIIIGLGVVTIALSFVYTKYRAEASDRFNACVRSCEEEESIPGQLVVFAPCKTKCASAKKSSGNGLFHLLDLLLRKR